MSRRVDSRHRLRRRKKTIVNEWPELPWAPWAETGEALHLWTQVAGKYRLSRTPWLNRV